MKKTYQIADRRLVEAAEDVGPIAIYANPEEQERKYLIDELKIDEHTLNSALDPDELSRLEFEPEHVAIIFKRPRNLSTGEQFAFGVASMGVFLFKDRLRIIVGEDGALLEGPPIQRVQSVPGVVLRLVARVVVHFREHLRAISMVSDELQNEINRSMENKHLISMFSLQKSLVYYFNSINSNGATLDKLRHNAARIGFSTDEAELLDDLIIENNQCLKQAEMYSNILASLMDARASIVANNLNVLMKRLNIITIGIMVPTAVVSAFSMNVRIPLATMDLAFWIIMALASLSVAAFLYLWKRLSG
ncbi:MAG TPA: magnesium transporter CorA family protein [Phycisphaerae bacterium]|nr:magnesium transporter CorA family protein [Phycisphaerae bacterium]HNU44876.1 magnesium transporter CorA family protein [Phycisphaerae bacterium]